MKHLCLAVALLALAGCNQRCDSPPSTAALEAEGSALASAVRLGWSCRDKGVSADDCVTQFADKIGGR